MSDGDRIHQGIYQSSLIRRIALWLDAAPHPLMACEIAPSYVAAARWSRGSGALEGYAIEPLPPGAIVPSAAEVNLAEPGALIGFAGPRVIKQTIGQDLPPGFQRSEFLLDKGFLDRIVSRGDIRATLIAILSFFTAKRAESA